VVAIGSAAEPQQEPQEPASDAEAATVIDAAAPQQHGSIARGVSSDVASRIAKMGCNVRIMAIVPTGRSAVPDRILSARPDDGQKRARGSDREPSG
jgi:hypothetical protein